MKVDRPAGPYYCTDCGAPDALQVAFDRPGVVMQARVGLCDACARRLSALLAIATRPALPKCGMPGCGTTASCSRCLV